MKGMHPGSLTWDIISYIANFISDPLTFEMYNQCCKRTHTAVCRLREQKRIEYINNIANYHDVHDIIYIAHHSAVNTAIIIVGNPHSGRKTLLNYIINNIDPKLRRIKIKIEDILRNPLSVVYIYERIICKKDPVCIIIKGTENYTLDEIDNLFLAKDIPFAGGMESITEWFENKIDYLPIHSIIIVTTKKQKRKHFFQRNRQFIVLETKK